MRAPTCPAVSDVVAESRRGGGAVVCGVIALDNAREGVSQHVDPVVSERTDPSTLAAYCTGRGLPADEERTHGGHRAAGETTCHTDCPVWRMEVDRREAAKRRGARAARLHDSGATHIEHPEAA